MFDRNERLVVCNTRYGDVQPARDRKPGSTLPSLLEYRIRTAPSRDTTVPT